MLYKTANAWKNKLWAIFFTKKDQSCHFINFENVMQFLTFPKRYQQQWNLETLTIPCIIKNLWKANLTMPPSFVQEFTKKLCIYKNILWFDQINLEEGKLTFNYCMKIFSHFSNYRRLE